MESKFGRKKGGLSFRRDQSGSVTIMAAIALFVLLGFAGLAIDVGHIMVVRNELQNAADATALAGALSLYPKTPPSSPEPPEWTTAAIQALNFKGYNNSDGAALNDAVVQTGYWNLAHTPSGLQGTGITPGPDDCAAVQVTVSRSGSKTDGKNGGSVYNWFGFFTGNQTSDVSAMATAVMCSPGTAKKGALLPIAIPKEMADKSDQFNNPSTRFKIGSSYHYPTGEGGQWTSFFADANDVPTITGLITDGNPAPVNIGDDIWIEPGTKTAVYGSIPAGADVLLPVVTNIDTHASVPVVGFIGFHVTASVGGSGKYVEGYFLPTLYAGNTIGNGGPIYGAYAPPTLVR